MNFPMDSKLMDAYQHTAYTISGFEIRIGQRNPQLDFLLEANQKIEWVYITAWNPKNENWNIERNQQANSALLLRLQMEGWTLLSGWGIGDQRDWPPEASFLVLGCSLGQGQKIAREFQQIAFLYGRKQDIPKLIYTENTE
jgi:hypothetical protein